MSKRKKKNQASGTVQLTLTAGETLAATREAPPPAPESTADMTSSSESAPAIATTAHAGAPAEAIATVNERAASASDADSTAASAGSELASPPPAAHDAPWQIDAPHGSLGQRLRAAREVRGWSIDDVAGRLRLPVQVIQTLETEQYEKIGYGIYLRGYLTSYARLVDVPTVLIEPVLRERSQTPPLVPSGTISHSRYLYQRYSVSALYLILTAVIIVPAVMLAMRASLQPEGFQLTALSAPAKSDKADAGTPPAAPTAEGRSSDDAASPPAAHAETPLVASLAPFSALSHKEPAARTDTPAAAASGAHTLRLSLKEASWVEVVAAGGEKIEYGLLPAGTVRSYGSDKALDVRLGNCNGAEIEADGKLQDLAPFRRANVAHFRLFTGADPITHADN